MTRLAVAAAVIAVIAAVGLLLPIQVRHNAPLGASQTIDPKRRIAVRGGYLTPNYDGFDRVDLDIRAYTRDQPYDFTLHIRPAKSDAPDIRTIALQLPADVVWNQKAAFANPFVTVGFPAVPDSAGVRYYVWLEAGPRNQDDIWTLWRIASYSHVRGYDVFWAWLRHPPEPLGSAVGGGVLAGLLLLGLAGIGWLAAALIGAGAGDLRTLSGPRQERRRRRA